jgi:Cysteine-rich CPXCG
LSDSIHDLDSEDSDSTLEPADQDTWDTEAEVICPYCGEAVTVGVDPAGGAIQTYVEDCQVCCRPWQIHVSYDDHGAATCGWTSPNAMASRSAPLTRLGPCHSSSMWATRQPRGKTFIKCP